MLSLFVIAFEAVILMVLLTSISDDEIEFTTAGIVSFVTVIGTNALAIGLGMALGPLGILLACLIAAVALGVAVSALFGTEIKRAILIGVIFMVSHIGIAILISIMFAR